MFTNFSRFQRRFFVAASLALTSAGLATTSARADLLIQAVNSSATPGGTGSFDIVLTDTGGSFEVAGFSVEPVVSSTSPITFTDVTADTISQPYIYGTYQSGPAPFSFSTFPGTDIIASDVDFSNPFFVTLSPGQSLGLAHVDYAAAPNATLGDTQITFATLGTSLSDNDGNAVAFTPVAGTISVVPEPASVGFFATLGIAELLRRRRQSV